MEILQDINLTFHHVGCITADIEASKQIYTNTLGFKNISQTYFITEQKVKVCFVETAPGCYIELVETTEENAFFSKLLKAKTAFYHTGYLTQHFDETLTALEAKDCRVINRFHSEAFEGKQCAFLYTSELHLVEIIEK